MNLLAVSFLLLSALQSTSAPQQSPPPTAPKPEAATPTPSATPVTLPAARTIRVIIPDSKAVEIVAPSGERQALSPEEIHRALAAMQTNRPMPNTTIVVENGAVYVSTGGFKIPLSGGGASGCFGVTPERNEQIQKEARLQLEREKAAPEKNK